MSKPAEQKRRGRPALPPDQRQTERVEIRCTQAQREKLTRLGGPQWLRDRINRAREKPPRQCGICAQLPPIVVELE